MNHGVSSRTTERVLAWMHHSAGEDHDEIEFSLDTAAAALDISRMTAHRALRVLTATGAITITRPAGGRRYPTRYRLLRPADAHTLRVVPRVSA